MRPGRLCALRGPQPPPKRLSSRLAGPTDDDGSGTPPVADGFVLRLGGPAVAAAFNGLRQRRDEARTGLRGVATAPRRRATIALGARTAMGSESQKIALRLRLKDGPSPGGFGLLFAIARRAAGRRSIGAQVASPPEHYRWPSHSRVAALQMKLSLPCADQCVRR